MEFRCRSRRVPTDLFPTGEVRIHLAEPRNEREREDVSEHRKLLGRLARQGQWIVLRAIKEGRRTVEEVARIAREFGFDGLERRVDRGPESPRLGAIIDPFLEQLVQLRTRATYAIGLRHLVTHFGPERRLARIGSHEIDDLVAEMRGRGLSPNTIATAKTAWSALFTWARRRESERARIQGRPSTLQGPHQIREADPVLVRPTRHRFLTDDEFDRLLDATIPPMRAHYATLLYCGLRIGELLHLRPQDVDIENDRIRIRVHEDWAPKGYPRYDRGVGDVPVHRIHLRPHLVHYGDEYAGHGRTFFVNPYTGSRWSYHAFRRRLKRDVESAGMRYGNRHSEGVTSHTFRHTLASWLAQRDVQLKKIAMILRDTVETVDERYAHLLPSDLDQTLQRAL